MICHQVPKAILDEVWPRVSDYLRDAITKGDDWWTLDEIRKTLKTHNDAALFVVADHDGIYGAAVVIVEDYPNGNRVAHFPALGGKQFSKWRHFLSEIEAWSRSRGATSLSVTGRKGWQRMLRGNGYQPTAVILDKAL